MPLALEHDELGLRDQLDLLLQQLDAGERVAVAAEKERRALDARPVLGAELIGIAGAMERIREEDEAAEVRLDGRHARDASSKRLTTTHYVVATTRGLDEDGHCFLRDSTRKIHC